MINKNWQRNCLNLGAGAVLTLTFAPFNYWYLSFISLAIFYGNLHKVSCKQSFGSGWWFGFGLFGSAVSWIYVSIHEYGPAPIWLAIFLTVLFCAGLACFFGLQAFVWLRWFKLKRNLWLNAVSFASLWLLFELLRRFLGGGFPWAYVGYSQINTYLVGFAPVGGVYLVSFSVVLVSVIVVSFSLTRETKKLLGLVVILVGVTGSGFILQQIKWTASSDQTLTVSLIQGNIDQQFKWDESYLNHQLNLQREMALQAPLSDIVVLAENAVPILLDYAQNYLNEISVQIPKTTLITGVPHRLFVEDGTTKYYNALVVKNVDEQGLYLKQQLVPFGEYVPFQDWLRGLIKFFDLPMSDFAEGPANQPPLMSHNFKIAAFICYEAAYADLVAHLAQDSGFLLTISNDTWFGSSIGPAQHLQIAQMRAVENGRPLVRATNNGVTAFVDHLGKIILVAPQFTQATLTGTITPRTGNTLYMLWRDYPMFLICLLLCGWAGYLRHKE